jgi:hypothetical protein
MEDHGVRRLIRLVSARVADPTDWPGLPDKAIQVLLDCNLRDNPAATR